LFKINQIIALLYSIDLQAFSGRILTGLAEFQFPQLIYGFGHLFYHKIDLFFGGKPAY
jgi:hypothetical protein